MGLVALFLIVCSFVALVLYGYLVAMLLAVMSFYTFKFGGKRAFPPVLSKEEDDAIESLRTKTRPSDVVTLLESIAENKEKASSFNGRALARAKVLQNYDKEKALLLRTCASLAHKSNSLAKAESLIEIAELAWKAMQQNEPVPSRIRREDLRVIESFAKSIDILDLFGHIDPGASKLLDRFRETVKKCRSWQESVLKALNAETQIRSGDLIAYTLENDRYIIGSLRPKFVQWFYQFALGSDATHMSLAVRGDDGAIYESHMWGVPSVYNRTKLTVGSFGNKVYRAKADLFVDKVGLKFGDLIFITCFFFFFF